VRNSSISKCHFVSNEKANKNVGLSHQIKFKTYFCIQKLKAVNIETALNIAINSVT